MMDLAKEVFAMKSLFEEMGGKYTRRGDYLLTNIAGNGRCGVQSNTVDNTCLAIIVLPDNLCQADVVLVPVREGCLEYDGVLSRCVGYQVRTTVSNVIGDCRRCSYRYQWLLGKHLDQSCRP